jgi:chlorobactene glucosyltransferase
VVIPARNERRWIGEAVASHCSQEYPGLQVIVVDDCSTDGTAEVLRSLQGRFPDLTVVRGTEPPEGWLGKTNALRLGLERATGEFVLLADADVRYAQGTHARAAREMLRRSLDMLVLLPRHEAPWGAELIVMHLDAIFLFGVPSFLYNAPWLRGFALGAGAGSLTRRRALDEVGGIEAVKDAVVDDILLGRRVKALRGRLRVVKAFDEVQVQMYASFREAFDGFTKNLYSFVGFTLWGLAVSVGGLFYYALPAGVLAGAALLPRPAVLLAALCVAFEFTLEVAACLWSGHRLWLAFLFPVRILVWMALLLRSAWQYHTKGLVWRGRTYKR